jgi:hypothetical protein
VETKTFELTLTRFHKVAERLSALASEKANEAKQIYTETTVSSWNKTGVADMGLRIAQEAETALTLYRKLLDTVVTIRSRLAVRNAEIGVSVKLTELQGLKRRITAFTEILVGQKADMVRPADIVEVPRDLVDDRGFTKSPLKLTLRLLDDAAVAAMRAEFATLQTRAHTLTDEISDLNRNRIKVELDDEIARLAGIAS